MAVLYIHLDYEGYKELEAQARAFAESTHKSTGGFYHKSLRLKIGKDMIIEFHGPLVGGYGHITYRALAFEPNHTFHDFTCDFEKYVPPSVGGA